MKKEFTLNDFTASAWYSPIVEEAEWSESYGDGWKWNVNTSTILTELIQNAGRWCERYASDLFISWTTVEKYLKNPHPENKSFLFGFRQNGVDHAEFVICRYNQNEYTDEYRAIYRLDIELVETEDKYWNDDKIRMTLYRVK